MTAEDIRTRARAASLTKGCAVRVTKKNGSTETLYMASAQSRDDVMQRAQARGYTVSILKP